MTTPIKITPANRETIPFPCWIWSPTNFGNDWQRVTIKSEVFEGDTHYSTSPTEPDCVPGEGRMTATEIAKGYTDRGLPVPLASPDPRALAAAREYDYIHSIGAANVSELAAIITRHFKGDK